MTEAIVPGTVLESLEVVDLTLDGGAVARHNGRVVFLDTGAPGEITRARVTDVRKKILRAQRLEILVPSPQAQAPWCPHLPDCGGCSLQGLSPQGRAIWKENQVRQTLRRIGGLADIPVEPLRPSPRERGGRVRVSYTFGFDAQGAFTVGLRRRGAHQVVPVHECGLQAPRAGEALRHMRARLGSLCLPGGRSPAEYLKRLNVYTPEYAADGPQTVVECLTRPESRPGEHDALRDFLCAAFAEARPEGLCLVHSEAGDPAASRAERTIWSDGVAGFREAAAGLVLEYPVTAFAQTNSGAADILYRLVAEKAGLSGRETVWDVYCGVGVIGLVLVASAGRLFGCDGNAEAVAAARQNATRLGFGERCEFVSGALPQIFAERAKHETPDVLLLDPPRAGLEEGVRAFLKACPARRLLYVSCDPATQARDLAELADSWRAVSAHPVDMFPTTTGVENLVVLESKVV